MKNRFLFNNRKKVDFIIIIPTVAKEKNQKRVEKILELIIKYPPKKFSYNIYLAYKGKDWNEAVNNSFKKLKNKVKEGFLLLDDDSFPLPGWMDDFERFVYKYKNSILQFNLVDTNGIIAWGRKLLKLNKLAMAFLSFWFSPLFIAKFKPYARSISVRKKTKVTRIHTAGFSAVFVPIKILNEIGGVKDRKEDNNIVYHEDSDFCYRAFMKGYFSYEIPRKVLHIGFVTKSKKVYEKMDKEEYSRIWLVKKWYTNREFIKKLREANLIDSKFTFLKIIWEGIKKKVMKFFSKKINPMSI